MKKLEYGETVLLDSGEEYTCFSDLEFEGETYAYLISNKKPIKLIIAKEVFDNDELILDIIEDKNMNRKIYKLFMDKIKKEGLENS